MSEFAFFRFKSANMLTDDEERDREEIIRLTEEVLDARDIECDARIAKISEEQLKEILEEVRKIRRKRKLSQMVSNDDSLDSDADIQNDNREPAYIK